MASDNTTYEAPVVPVNWSVQWLPHGKPNEVPWCAQVLLSTTTSGLRLFVRSPNGRCDIKSGVRNIDDPQLQNLDSTARAARGAWRWMPGLEAPQPEQRSRDELEQHIVDLAVNGGEDGRELSAVMIAQQLNQEAKKAGQAEDWNHQKVNAILRRQQVTTSK